MQHSLTFRLSVIALSSLGVALTAHAQTSDAFVPAATPVLVSLPQGYHGGDGKVGDDVVYLVDNDVRDASGRLLIAAGSHAHGTIKSTHRQGGWSVNGKVALTCDYVEAIDGSHIALQNAVVCDKGGGASDWHFLVFGILGLWLIPGDQASVDGGTVFVVKTSADAKVSQTNTAVTPFRLHLVPKSGAAIDGSPKSFDGKTVTFTSGSGDQTIKVNDIKAITAAAG